MSALARKRFLTLEETAQLLSVSRRTVLNWRRAGRIPSARIGGVVRVDAEALERQLAAQLRREVGDA